MYDIQNILYKAGQQSRLITGSDKSLFVLFLSYNFKDKTKEEDIKNVPCKKSSVNILLFMLRRTNANPLGHKIDFVLKINNTFFRT